MAKKPADSRWWALVDRRRVRHLEIEADVLHALAPVIELGILVQEGWHQKELVWQGIHFIVLVYVELLDWSCLRLFWNDCVALVSVLCLGLARWGARYLSAMFLLFPCLLSVYSPPPPPFRSRYIILFLYAFQVFEWKKKLGGGGVRKEGENQMLCVNVIYWLTWI